MHSEHCENNISKSKYNAIPEDKILLQPFNYIDMIPSKQIRTKFAKALNHWFNISLEKYEAIGEITQMLHTASLLLDDIEDNSVLRRGVPAAHIIYGNSSTINCANYVCFLVLDKALSLNNPKASAVVTRTLLELYRGVGMEVYWRDNLICPSEEEYKQMVIRKTSSLFELNFQLMQLFSENMSDFSRIGKLFGTYMQIRDDHECLNSPEYAKKKSYCEDLTEGKFSFPIIHFIKTYPEDDRIINILKQKTTDVNLKKRAVDILEEFGSFKYTREVLVSLEKEIHEEITALGGNAELLEIITSLKIKC